MLKRLQNEPILLPASLTSLTILVHDVFTALDGQTVWAALPVIVGLVSRYFVTGPVTAARQVAQEQGA